MQSSDQYRLIFEGPKDDSDETLRNLKGTFITELEFSVDEAKEILENTPYQILAATSEADLHNFYESINSAGGKVLIVRPESDESEESFEFTFDMEEASEQLTPKKTQEKPAPVYSLEFDPENDPTEDETVKELLAEGDAESKQAMSTPPESEALGLSDLSFDAPNHEPTNIINPDEEPEPEAIALDFDTGETSVDLTEQKKKAAPISGVIEPTSSIDNLGLSFDEPEQEKLEQSESIVDEEESTLEEEESIVPVSDSLSLSPEEPSTLDALEEVVEAETTETTSDALEVEQEYAVETQEPEPQQEPQATQTTVESRQESIAQPEPQEESALREDVVSEPEIEPETEYFQEAPEDYHAENVKSDTETRNKQALIIGIVALLILGNGYFIYSNFLAGDDMAGTEQTINSIIESAAKASKKAAVMKKKAAQNKKKEPTVSYQFEEIQGSTPIPYGDLTWELTVRGPQLVSGTMRLTTPRPRDRTPAEIVRGMKPIPWLTKAEFHSLKFLPIEEQQYKSSGVAKLYIEHDGKRRRIVAPATVTGTYNPETKLLEGEIEIENDFEGTKRHEVFVLENIKGTAYSLYLHSFFSNRSPEEQLSESSGETPSLRLPSVEHVTPKDPTTAKKEVIQEKPKPKPSKKNPTEEWDDIAGLETLF